MTTALVTGAAGFVGFHAAKRWLDEGFRVVGLDSVSDYYDPALKEARLDILNGYEGFSLVRDRVEAPGVLNDLMAEHAPRHVIHLAAQAGVRHSIDAPRDYMSANIQGTFELLEAARAHPGAHLLIASTSSVYGANTKMPYGETDKADTQMSFYAATKKATEAMAHSYAHLYDLPVTMFRFFTVYGPWGRPDMAYFKFVKAILEGQPIEIYNHGNMARDFTFIDDLIEAVWRLSEVRPMRPGSDDRVAAHDSLSAVAPFRVVNIGKAAPDRLGDFIAAIEEALGMNAEKVYKEMQPGDVPATHSDTTLLRDLTGYACKTPISEGIPRFVTWYRAHYGV
ncbi:SDR family NAD(P)-dependent oxidoreductase [Alphaproteobacteria bacterium GH1-50]|uniref:SDR family NAD(P)-dependent oxidoreductase n=1 Tax=Kangsaoukella pontilimi TaxID=2691042 RepID=A0A7C9IE29_9RHOB|nr:SDR family NAD(P)-dependent oxidoreductase [Kangsaoukella pontilimi]MXQ06424.1 SDR family NAD(P)-dependent oxidoreductase [Kangsaoukella pontilimi]